jgi:hypothetical protein
MPDLAIEASRLVVYELTPTNVLGLPGIAGTDQSGVGPEGSFSPTRWRF